jgi:hypothetical protein
MLISSTEGNDAASQSRHIHRSLAAYKSPLISAGHATTAIAEKAKAVNSPALYTSGVRQRASVAISDGNGSNAFGQPHHIHRGPALIYRPIA